MSGLRNKITLISSLPPIKGISPYTVSLITNLQNKIDIDFIGFDHIYPEFLYPGGSKTNSFQKYKFNSNVKVNNTINWYNPFSWMVAGFSIKTKIVHAQWWSWVLAPIYLMILSIAKLRGKKIILTIHNVNPHEKLFIAKFLNNSVIKLADEYVVHSLENKKTFLEISKTDKPIHIVPHPPILLPKCNLSLEDLRKKYSYTSKDKIILFFGNIRPYKGLDILLKAMSLIKDNNIKLIIAGKPWDNFNSYQQIIDKNNLQSRCKLILEFISDEQLSELCSLTNIFCFPYKHFDSASGVVSVTSQYPKYTITSDKINNQKLNNIVQFNSKNNKIQNLANLITKLINQKVKTIVNTVDYSKIYK